MAQKPLSVGIIMDGNRRWAKEHGLPTFEGHKAGYEKTKEVTQWCRSAGIKYLTIYAFSNENWNRSKEEVAYLLDIFNEILFNKVDEFRKENGAVTFIGDLSRFGEAFEAQAKHAEATNPKEPSLTVVIALSYGGRQEIVQAVNTLLKEGKKEVSEAEFAERLYTRGIPDPDLIIRTSGEQRLSGFLPWQSIYSELFFSPTYWPDFSEDDFNKILEEYAARERRLGK